MDNPWLYRLVLALAVSVPGSAQEQPAMSVRGTFSTGFYSTSSRGEYNQSMQFVPFGAKFDVNGYYRTPDLLDFSFRPELNAGPQASEAGFQGGNGIQLRLTFLRRLMPVTFRYSNLQVEDVYFGGLSQISGYSLKNRNKDLGLTLELKPRGLPATVIDWGTGSVDSKSGTAGISDYLSQGNHENIDTKYERWSWVLDGFFHRQEQASNILEPIDGGTQFGTLRQTVLQYQGSARRGFWDDSELYVNAGRQSTSSMLFELPIDLSTRYADVTARFMQKHHWRSAVRAAYSSNLASQLLAQAAGSLGGANAIAADDTVLLPFSHGLGNYNLTGTTSATLPHGFGLYGSVERNAIVSSYNEGPLNADYFTTSGGITYAARTHWGSIAGEYGREFGEGSVTGQSGTIQGQTWRASVQRGRSGGVEIDGSVHGAEQSVENEQPLSNRSIAMEASIAGRIFDEITGRVGGGWQWGDILNSANDFRTDGYTARIGLEHPRVQASLTLNQDASNSLPFYNEVLGGLGLDAALFTAPRVIPSDFRAMGFTLHTNPTRKVELSVVWTRSRQHLDRVLNNDFEIMNAFARYHFRRIELEAGFTRSFQVFASYPNTLRTRFYLRVLRNAKLL